MVATPAAAAGPPTTTGRRCVAEASSDPSPMAVTLAVVTPRSIITGLTFAATAC